MIKENTMNYEKPEFFELGKAQDAILGNPKGLLDIDALLLCRGPDIPVDEIDE
jgi:hypothetical protein